MDLKGGSLLVVVNHSSLSFGEKFLQIFCIVSKSSTG